MSDPGVLGFKLRLALAALISVAALAIGLLGSGGQSPSWAAPNQNPHMQTVPTRPPPTAEPVPTLVLTPSPTSPKDGSGGDNTPLAHPPDEGGETLPAQASEQKDNEGSNKASPTRLPEPESARDQTRVPPGESPGEKAMRDTALITPQPADLSLPKTTDSATQAGGEVITFTKAVTPVSTSRPAPASPSDRVGSLGWLCALGLGVILILSGIFLVKRA